MVDSMGSSVQSTPKVSYFFKPVFSTSHLSNLHPRHSLPPYILPLSTTTS